MTTPTELETEYSNLLHERAIIQKACMDEWPIMPAQVARNRQDRLWAIRDRLTAIEKTKGFGQ